LEQFLRHLDRFQQGTNARLALHHPAPPLHQSVPRLPEDFREVYRLHALEGRYYEEISAQLRIPKATVGTRLIRARRKLRDLLMPSTVEETAHALA